MTKEEVEIDVVPLDPTHNRHAFDCGSEELNTYLRNNASQHMAKGISKSYVLYNVLEPSTVLGFFTVGLVTLDPQAFPTEFIKRQKLPKSGTLPAVLLGRLATDKQWQGHGYGAHMLIEALSLAVEIDARMGCVAVFVQAKDDNAKQFYQKFGFLVFPDEPFKLFLPMQLVRQVVEAVTESKKENEQIA